MDFKNAAMKRKQGRNYTMTKCLNRVRFWKNDESNDDLLVLLFIKDGF